MSQIKCRNCEREYDNELIICPHCDTPTNPKIPNYPRFKGPGIMMFFFIFFVLLLIGMAVSYFSQ